MKVLNGNQMSSLNGGECQPDLLFQFICVLRITGNHLTDVCHSLGADFLGLICD